MIIIKLQGSSAFTGPSLLFCRDTRKDSIIRHIGLDDCTGAYHGISPDGGSAYNCGICAYGSASFDKGRQELMLSLDKGPWIVYIGKYHRRAAEHLVFQGHTFVYRDIVLDFTSVSYCHIRADDYVLADYTVLSYL